MIEQPDRLETSDLKPMTVLCARHAELSCNGGGLSCS